jgi:tetratricopeptide (TPR) repeat protein
MYSRFVKYALIPLVLLGCCLTSSRPVMAEVLDELQVQPDKRDNVIRIKFNARIRYVRHAAAEGTNSMLVYFQIVQGREMQVQVVESLQSKPVGSLPGLSVTFPPQPGVQIKELKITFSKRTVATVGQGRGGESLEIEFADVGKSSVKDINRYAIRLMSASDKEILGSKVIPARFSDFDVFTSQQTVNGIAQYELLMGYLPTAEAAEKLRRQLLTRFPDATVVDFASRKQQSIEVAAEQAAETPAIQAFAPGASPEVAQQADSLMKQAKAAMDAGNYEQAVNLLNQLLFLPPNAQSQEGQELIGLARERNGEFAKAKAEYELYLKLFPEGEGATRVKQQLAALGTKLEAAPAARGAAARATAPQRVVKTVNGSVSQYYYGGQSQIQTAFNTPTSVEKSTISGIDQSLLVTNVDLNARYRDASADQRIVFRDTYSWSFLDTNDSYNRMTTAYYDYKGLENNIYARIGRQTGYSGGLPNRFDGALLGYRFAPKLKLNVAAGLPVEFPTIDSSRKFWEISLDADSLAGRWSGNVFFIDQWVDGISDRRATGGEIRYFDELRSLYTLLDYDVSYDVMNIAMLQGSWQTAGQTTISLLLDRRRAPTLSTNNALYNNTVTAMVPPPTSIKQLLNIYSEDEIRALAENATAVAYQAQLSLTQPLNPTWQLGLDIGMVNIGALPAVTLPDNTVIEPSPATGNMYSTSLRAIGTNLYSGRDINVFSLSYTNAPQSTPAFNGVQLAYNNTTYLGDKWLLEPSLKYYRQQTDPNIDLARWTPGIRLSYRVKETLSLDGEYIYEHTTTDSPGTQDISQTHYFSLGYRWDY